MKWPDYSYEMFSSVEASSVDDSSLEKTSKLFFFMFYYNMQY